VNIAVLKQHINKMHANFKWTITCREMLCIFEYESSKSDIQGGSKKSTAGLFE